MKLTLLLVLCATLCLCQPVVGDGRSFQSGVEQGKQRLGDLVKRRLARSPSRDVPPGLNMYKAGDSGGDIEQW